MRFDKIEHTTLFFCSPERCLLNLPTQLHKITSIKFWQNKTVFSFSLLWCLLSSSTSTSTHYIVHRIQSPLNYILTSKNSSGSGSISFTVPSSFLFFTICSFGDCGIGISVVTTAMSTALALALELELAFMLL